MTMRSAGFTDREVAEGWGQGRGFLLRDSRVQLLLSKAANYDMAERARAELTHKRAREAPPVQRPGIARNVFDDGSVNPRNGQSLQGQDGRCSRGGDAS
jgi:hypothetical protein